MKNRIHKSTNVIFAKNKKNTHNWAHKDLARKLYSWIDIFNNAFFKEEPVPVDAISFENKRVAARHAATFLLTSPSFSSQTGLTHAIIFSIYTFVIVLCLTNHLTFRQRGFA